MGIFDIFKKKSYSEYHQKQINSLKQNINQTKNIFKEQKATIHQLRNELSTFFEVDNKSDELNLPIYDKQLKESIEIIKTSKNPDTVI